MLTSIPSFLPARPAPHPLPLKMRTTPTCGAGLGNHKTPPSPLNYRYGVVESVSYTHLADLIQGY